MTNWRKSTRSADTANCVEVRLVPDLVQMRDSKDPTGPVISYKLDAWRRFIIDTRKGALDREESWLPGS